ncbi:MAG: Mfa1 family fimbria major subunit [Clostridium sp.]|nr:Mfa1 family fimbria major subunit [Prevotella sp.]MCM1429026.1 Mfa1 family fimbria major subunit [Clostridium sp.]MCM1475443.1 Mfa1 family fimbria major subunit [Muribaculaceae bacterium]
MKLFTKFLFGCTAVAFAACSSDEPMVDPNTPDVVDGEVAYMAIKITSAQDGTRATTPGGYVGSQLTELEHKVNSVQFLFFNKEGAYAFTAKGDESENNFKPATEGTPNVEYVGAKNILILNGVRKNDYPEYMITVLNAPGDFTPGATMQETADILADYALDFDKTRTAPFIMTTSSFNGNKNGASGVKRHDATFYYATKLDKDDFQPTEDLARNVPNPVEIYVERLAAKVEVKLGGALGNEYITDDDNNRYYKLQQTVAGGNNVVASDGDQSQTELYVRVIGWGLNSTAKKSYMSKKLNTTWADNAFTFDWNVPADWRSYWGMSYIYGNKTNVNLNYTKPATVVSSESRNSIGDVDYCYENTNTPDNIFASLLGSPIKMGSDAVGVKNSMATHVVLHTRIYEKDGNVLRPLSMVQYRGLLFKDADFKAHVLNTIKAEKHLNFWVKDGENKWVTIDESYLVSSRDEAADHKLGEIKITAKPLAAGQKVYYKDAEGEYQPYAEGAFEASVNGYIKTILDANAAVGSDSNGDAFYYVAIEHLAADKNQENAVEGYYGVVRNHWYVISINSFKKVGHLVFDPEHDTTEIIPEDPEDPMYYVGANINILSWKVVNQTASDL